MGNDWRTAYSITILQAQINILCPGRDRKSDGTIGDKAHTLTQSDHNPDNQGIVRAVDITHDPNHGMDISALLDILAASQDSRIKYIIADHVIVSGNSGPYPWKKRAYKGSNPHTDHLHLSVIRGGEADNRRGWRLAGFPFRETSGGKMAGFLKIKGRTEVFFTTGSTSFWVQSMDDVRGAQILSQVEIFPSLGNNGNIWELAPGSIGLIPPITGPVPPGYESRKA